MIFDYIKQPGSNVLHMLGSEHFNSLKYFVNQPELVMLVIGPAIYQFIILNALQIKKKRTNRFIFGKWQEPANDHCIVSMYLMHRERCGKFFITICVLRALSFACANAQCDCRVLSVLSHNPMSTHSLKTFIWLTLRWFNIDYYIRTHKKIRNTFFSH